MKVVVLGCGLGGVEVVRTLRKEEKELDIMIIERAPQLGYMPAYPELLSGKVTPQAISYDLKDFATGIGAGFILAEVVNIDFKAKEVKIRANAEDKVRDISYDFLVIAIGAEQTFFGIPGAEKWSYTVNTMKGAIETRNALDTLDYSKESRIAVVGGGLTGVEVAGELVDYFKDRGALAGISLIEMMPRILPALPRENVAIYVSKFLSEKGVEILTEMAVQEVKEGGITFKDGRKLPYDIIIWTAGIKPNGLLAILDIPKVKGWIKVDSYLRVEGMDDVFAVGDTIYFEHGGVRAGQNVKEAEGQGRVAAKSIIRTIRREKLKRYRPKNTIQSPRVLISLGDGKAVMYFGGMVFKVFAYRLKKFVEHQYMRRFRQALIEQSQR